MFSFIREQHFHWQECISMSLKLDLTFHTSFVEYTKAVDCVIVLTEY